MPNAATVNSTPTLASGAPATLPNPSAPVTTTPALSGDALNSYLNDSFNNSSTAGTIMDQYNASKQADQTANAATSQQIQDTGNMDLQFLNEQTGNQLTGAQESQRGFIANPGALNYLQDSSTKRIRDLQTQITDALASNNTDLAKNLSDLSLQENTAITQARTSFLSNYFQSQSEARSQASFQTPVQSAVLSLAGSYPDAGILPTDDMATASQKAQNAPSFKNNIAKGQADIKNALAQAAAAPVEAQAALTSAAGSYVQAQANASQTNTLLGMIGGIDQNNPDVIALKNGSLTQDELIKNNSGYGPLGGAYAQAVIKAAQASGYNVNQGNLTSLGQQNTVDAFTSGNPFSAITSAATQFGLAGYRALTGAGGTPVAVPKGTDGTLYGFPGYHSDGQQWVKN